MIEMNPREQKLLRQLIREHARVNEDLSDIWDTFKSTVSSGVGKAFDVLQGTDVGVKLGLVDPSKNVILRRLEDLSPDVAATPVVSQQPPEPMISSGVKDLSKVSPESFGDFDPSVFADIMPSQLGDRYVNQFSINSNRTDFDDIIQRAADETGVPFEMIRAVIGAESAFKPQAYSGADAAGLMQFIESTAAAYGLSPDDRYDPEKVIPAGAKLLRDLRNQFGNWPEALAAYNAGPGNVTTGRWLSIPETRNYVPTVMAYYHAEGGRGYT